jgi:hypothetical protein
MIKDSPSTAPQAMQPAVAERCMQAVLQLAGPAAAKMMMTQPDEQSSDNRSEVIAEFSTLWTLLCTQGERLAAVGCSFAGVVSDLCTVNHSREELMRPKIECVGLSCEEA